MTQNSMQRYMMYAVSDNAIIIGFLMINRKFSLCDVNNIFCVENTLFMS